MHQRIPRQIIIQKARDRPNSLNRPPKHQILWTVPSIQRHNLPRLNPQLLHQPVAHARDQCEELAICVLPALEHNEQLLGSLVEALVAQDVEVCEAVLGDDFGEETLGGDAVEDKAQVVPNVVFSVEVCCCCGAAGGCCYEREDCVWMALLATPFLCS